MGDAPTDARLKPHPVPRAPELDEIAGVVAKFRHGAAYALAVGFGSVEIHGANGYKPDQFVQDGFNRRTDAYGGPTANRARFLLEITEAATAVWGGERVGVRLSPSGKYGSTADNDPSATFGYIAEALNAFGLASLHIVEPRIRGNGTVNAAAPPVATRELRRIFKCPVIAAGGFDKASAAANSGCHGPATPQAPPESRQAD